jgi:lipopolysaccharide export system protein LptA
MDRSRLHSDSVLLAGLVFALCLGLFLQSVEAAPAELGGSNATQITSQKVVYVGGENQVEFQGDVHVSRDDFELWCARLKVYLSKQAGAGQEGGAASDQVQGRDQIDRIMAYDDVRIEMEARQARSDEAEYRADEEKLFLRGNVVLTEGKNRIQGEQVVFDLRRNTSEVTAGDSGQVRALFFPDDEDEESP